MSRTTKPTVTFIQQKGPVDEYGRALYAISRSVLRALIDSLSNEDLTDFNTPIEDVTLRQLAKIARVDLDKGMRGDGFEWAVHEALLGSEPTVCEMVYRAMKRAAPKLRDEAPTSLMFGQERAKYLGFMDATIDQAGGDEALLLPTGSGRPFRFANYIPTAAQGFRAEDHLPDRIKKVWKTDLFLSTEDDSRHLAATVKSNFGLLEGGNGLRVAIVPESTHPSNQSGVYFDQKSKLWVASLADPNGFMGLFNDGYHAVMRALCSIGKQPKPPYFVKPSAKAQKVQDQLEKFAGAEVLEVEAALDEAAQQNLVGVEKALVGVNAPNWLRMKTLAPKIISPKPSFVRLD
ncbi:hypothetical protein [Aurantiacibacter spongiae]|uniref:Uncharacterized protein n=1 Tax=Aurantiacibacter spongiae TaxID=2488860 RepID=A0A3N5CTJ4_9SPHN|nr:hypothetical protein [Aurantiacibacter spongiae]RPF71626.1 hypothetical protein EG799_08330 [Aurantiacibacter spongiae]